MSEASAEAPALDEQSDETTAFIPAEITMFRPQAVNVQKFEDGSASFELLISPFQVVEFSLPPQAVEGLVEKLTGGVAVFRSIPDFPQGRRPH